MKARACAERSGICCGTTARLSVSGEVGSGAEAGSHERIRGAQTLNCSWPACVTSFLNKARLDCATNLLELLPRIGLAIAMAIFMGLAFEGVYKAETHSCPGGIRTFPMLVVLGTLLYLLEPQSLGALSDRARGGRALALWLRPQRAARQSVRPRSHGAGKQSAGLRPRSDSDHPAAVAGGSSGGSGRHAAQGRVTLHRLVKKVPSEEVFTLGKFLILIGVILPLLPDRPIVTWTTITPFRAWLALVAVSSLSYVSYLLQRYLPQRAGLLWPSILGGAYSSTATTVALAREQAASVQPRPELAGGIVTATAVMYLRIEVVTVLFNPALARALLPALLALCALGALVAAWLWSRSTVGTAAPTTLAAINPLQLGTAAVFAGLFVLLAVATHWVSYTFGAGGGVRARCRERPDRHRPVRAQSRAGLGAGHGAALARCRDPARGFLE